MNLFFDTSALVKYFHEEVGASRVTMLIDDPAHAVWVSELAHVEFVSAVHRKYREGVLNDNQLDQALTGFAETLRSFHVEPLGRRVAERTRVLLMVGCATWPCEQAARLFIRYAIVRSDWQEGWSPSRWG